MKRQFKAVGVAVALAMAITACGSSSKSSNSSSPTTAAANKATGDPIIVGGVAELKFYPGVEDGVNARLNRENNNGGINGRPIQLKGIQDDNADPQRNTTIVRSLVQQDRVFAVMPVVTDMFTAASSDFLAKQNTPYVGWGVDPGFCNTPPYGFAFTGCLLNPKIVNGSLVDPVIAQSGKPASELKVALQSGDNPQGKGGNALYEAIFKARGSDVVYNRSDLPAVDPPTSYAPYVQAIMDSNPDIVYVSTNQPNEIGLSGALHAAGFKGMIVGFTTYAPGLLDSQANVASAINGNYINVQLPPQEEQTPAIKQLQDDLKAIGKPTDVTFGVSQGYWQADLFISMLKAVKGDLTGPALKDAMKGFKYQSALQGGLGDVEYPKNQAVATPCAALVQVKDGKYEVTQPFKCYANIPL